MEGNKDESEKCIRIAERAFAAGDKEKALKFVAKAEKLYPSKRAKGGYIILYGCLENGVFLIRRVGSCIADRRQEAA